MRSVRTRVTAAATLAALVVALLASVLFLFSLQRSMGNQLVIAAEQDIADIRTALRRGQDRDRAAITTKTDVIVQILDSQGLIDATDHPGVYTTLRDEPGVYRDVRPRGLDDHYLVVVRAIGDRSGSIVVGVSTDQIDRATRAASLLLLVAVPVGLALIAGVVWVSVGQALRPVESIRREAEAISAAHADERLAVPPGDDEIARLAATLNEMLGRIGAASALQRQFVSDASHELRSPLTALRQLAEVARDYPGRTSQQDLARDVLVEEQRMEELVSALLLLARVDDGTEATSEPVDLDDLVLAEARRIGDPRVDVSRVSAGQVAGDAVLLRQVVVNLLANARRHARTTIAVSLQEAEGSVVLTVDDDGDGIPPEQRELVFERFVRLDEARTRDSGGSGLGLAIVHKVVSGLGGTVGVQESSTGGARFVVTLPASGRLP